MTKEITLETKSGSRLFDSTGKRHEILGSSHVASNLAPALLHVVAVAEISMLSLELKQAIPYHEMSMVCNHEMSMPWYTTLA